jgi:hypothetical protein
VPVTAGNGFSLPVTEPQELTRGAALARYSHKITLIGELGRAADVLPVFVDWTAFLGLGAGGRCLWIDHDEVPGKVEPVLELQSLSLLVHCAAAVPGLESLAPSRPASRADCSICHGKGHLIVGTVEVGCICGGLGWRAETAAELGLEAW